MRMLATALVFAVFLASIRADETKPTPPASAPATQPGVETLDDGTLLLHPQGARIHGYKLHVEAKPEPTLVYWIDTAEYPEWPHAAKKGNYTVEITYSCPARAGGAFSVAAAANDVSGRAEPTGDWQTYKTIKVGTLGVLNDGTSISVRAAAGKGSHAMMNIRLIKLTPTTEAPKPTKKKK